VKTAKNVKGARVPRRAAGRGVTYEAMRRLVLALPQVEEGTCYGTPGWRVARKLFARLREDGALVLRTDLEERERLIAADPAAFYVTDHYLAYPWVLVRLSNVGRDVLRGLIESAWRRSAPKKVLAAPTAGARKRKA
jgi:hypothetical protein